MDGVTVTSRTPLTQAAVRDGIIELAIGQPEPTLLPTLDLATAAASALHKYGADALGYGAEYGPWPLVGLVVLAVVGFKKGWWGQHRSGHGSPWHQATTPTTPSTEPTTPTTPPSTPPSEDPQDAPRV